MRLGHRIGYDRPALEAEPPAGGEGGGNLRGLVDAIIHGVAAVRCVERGETIGSVADDRDSHRLEVLEGASQVEDGLRPRGNHRDRRAGELLQVCRDVPGGLSPAVNPADTAGCEHTDSAEVRTDHGPGHRRCRGHPPGNRDAEVPPARLYDIIPLGQAGEVIVCEPDLDAPVDEGDGGRRCSGLANGSLEQSGRLEVLRMGHAVCDDGRLERDDAPPVAACVGHLFGHIEKRVDIPHDPLPRGNC